MYNGSTIDFNSRHRRVIEKRIECLRARSSSSQSLNKTDNGELLALTALLDQIKTYQEWIFGQ